MVRISMTKISEILDKIKSSDYFTALFFTNQEYVLIYKDN